MVQKIQSPLRILILVPSTSLVPSIFQEAQTYSISNSYYEASIPIWREDFSFDSAHVDQWTQQWAGEEAQEVVEAIGAVIVCHEPPTTTEERKQILKTLKAVHDIVELHISNSSTVLDKPLLLALSSSSTATEASAADLSDWEDLCLDQGGWEAIDASTDPEHHLVAPTNYGCNDCNEKIGMARLEEALEANDWEAAGLNTASTAASEDATTDDATWDISSEANASHHETGPRSSLQEELLPKSQRNSSHFHEPQEDENVSEEEVEALEAMMLRMQAAREIGADMPSIERKKLARKAVKEIMREAS